MFEEVIFECNTTNEDEFMGGSIKGVITLKSLLDWMDSVNLSNNKKYLKCLNVKGGKITLNSIVDVTFSTGLIHKTRSIPYGVKAAFKEGIESDNAESFQRIYELFTKIAGVCAEANVDTNNVEVFLEDEKGKLTQFGWYYDTDTDTAVIHKNMNNRIAKDFVHNPDAENLIVRAAKTSKTPDAIIDKLAKIEEQIKALELKKDAAYQELDAM